MGTYIIHPGNIESILNRTRVHIRPLEKQRKALRVNLADAAEGCHSPIVGAALLRFAQQVDPRLLGMGNRIVRATDGAFKATGFYLAADQEMGERARRHARKGAAAQRWGLVMPGADGQFGK
ncbi:MULTISPECIES: DUF6507 family protein [Thermomonosporaceae]|uniref:DUF6507 family protein n=1 Tax=Thermomonosporaceae TaxID=2012 RepID=UPI00255AA206|nr:MULTISPECIES: DUF6507 family protein [Thermomonosporaceae]MDL4772401.1 DUF6507 family protein [Actinomadura xylanilytica]